MTNAARAAEQVARASYGKLIAILAKRAGDIATAEDVLADAFEAALLHWQNKGVPENPEAWLLTVSRNRLTDRQRKQMRFPEIMEQPDMPSSENLKRSSSLPDERLALMLVCCHPALSSDLHAPLMLQTVLGVEAAEIGRLFLVPASTMAQRLVRAKRKIKEARIPFSLPDEETLTERLDAVLEAIYAAHSLDWFDPTDDLGEEALFLADLLARLRPEDAEIKGLLSLIALGHSRRGARLKDGLFVPVEEQDTELWDIELINFGLLNLRRAEALKQIGRFQIEAAIQSVHIARSHSGRTDWEALNTLYFALDRIRPSLGAKVAQAVVTARLHGASEGLVVLDGLETAAGQDFQPYWAARADMYRELGDRRRAIAAYARALELTDNPHLRHFLECRQAHLLR